MSYAIIYLILKSMCPLDLEETLAIDPLERGYIFAREFSYLIRSCNKLIVHIYLNS